MVAILGILVAVVVVSVVGFMGRGAETGYNGDEHNLKTAVAAFVADKHVRDDVNGWNEADSTDPPDFKFPTLNGSYSALYTGDAVEVGGQNVHILMKAADTPAETTDVEKAAIWMGLLVNEPGSGVNPDDKDTSAPLAEEHGLYINEVPESCSLHNSSKGKGTYTWIVGSGGSIYGLFPFDGDGDGANEWYIGFSGSYP